MLRPTAGTNVSPANMAEGGQSPASVPPVDGIASGVAPRPRRARIPMSIPMRRLEVAEITGYRLYWHKQENVPRALQAGYEFVKAKEVELNATEIGGHSSGSANTDLGSDVSLISGTTEQGDPQRLVLMKLPLDYFKDDQMQIASRNAAAIGGIFNNEQVIGPNGEIDDMGQLVYTPETGKSFRSRGRKEFLPVMNRPKRVVTVGRGRG